MHDHKANDTKKPEEGNWSERPPDTMRVIGPGGAIIRAATAKQARSTGPEKTGKLWGSPYDDDDIFFLLVGPSLQGPQRLACESACRTLQWTQWTGARSLTRTFDDFHPFSSVFLARIRITSWPVHRQSPVPRPGGLCGDSGILVRVSMRPSLCRGFWLWIGAHPQL
ncbi:hypothetical protein P170DRAFT_478706 [Aspergillus steynii IBT 23096]|uniref:Uncharacterized protein n=1 Tax=Aspergillus steynii IBT 23096 TaxID=1392250 RepID=A0A2I2FYQ1_9EURO|nr:uncharacterized protein P170DRAFT_478706 [Aspergillus steynii IBT 23096]PLB45770.1 hypothetical protein P170DRAFT_478706 [Aspergillus steynii IBT 23096]